MDGYQALLDARGALDSDDLVVKARRLLALDAALRLLAAPQDNPRGDQRRRSAVYQSRAHEMARKLLVSSLG